MSKRDNRVDAMPAPLESAEQIKFADWANAKHLNWYHVPNESALTGHLRRALIASLGETRGREQATTVGNIIGSRLRRMGLKSGVADIIIHTRSRKMIEAGALGIAIELKRETGAVSYTHLTLPTNREV